MNLIAVVMAGLVLVAGICVAAFSTIITADNYNLQEILATIPPHWLTILALLVRADMALVAVQVARGLRPRSG